MKIRPLELKRLEKVWPEIDKHFKDAYDRELMDPMDLYAYLLEQRAQFWVVTEGKTVIGYGVFIIKQWPKCKILDVPIVCTVKNGTFPTRLVIRAGERLARDSKCSKIIFNGRLGWKRRVRDQGYITRSAVFEKVL